MSQYSTLSEAEKIPLRIEMAEKLAREDAALGYNLEYNLDICVKNGLYCAAEGTKRAIAKVNNMQLIL